MILSAGRSHDTLRNIMKKSYLATTLQPGERIFYQGKPHPAFLIPHALIALGFFWAVAKGISVFAVAAVVPWAWAALLVPVGYLFSQIIIYLTSEAALTSDRVLWKSGLIRREISEIHLGKIESMSIDQGILGRMLGFADLHINGSGGHAVTALAVAHVMRFRAAVQNAIAQRAAGQEAVLTAR